MNMSTVKPGFFVQDRFLYSKDNEKVVLRGINHMFIWTDREGKTIPEIAKTGANCVRIVWNTRGRVSDLDNIISQCIMNGMIPIPEIHDTTGKWERLPDALEFWLREETLQMISNHQQYLILNVGNEPGDTEMPPDDFFSAYNAIVTRMRAAGIRVPLMIDADNWGQSERNLLDVGPRLLQSDPEHNLLFSIHMWWPSDLHDAKKTGYPTVEARVKGVLEESVKRKLPLVVGEFAPVAVGGVKAIPYKLIMSEAERLNIGWLAWSFGPGNFDSPEMDMTLHSSYNTLVGWGKEVCIDNPNGIQNTSVIPTFIQEKNFDTGSQVMGTNLIQNGDFSAVDPLENWSVDFWGGKAEVNVKDGIVRFDIKNAGRESWNLQFKQRLGLRNGVTYIFSMRAKADKPRTLNVNIKKDAEKYTPYANGRILDLSTSWQNFSWKFTMKEDTDMDALLIYDMGGLPISWSLADVSLVQARSVADRLNRTFQRNVQKNSGYFNAPNDPWELHLYSVKGELLEVLDKGKGGEGMRQYPKTERSGIMVVKDLST
ncbi:cellulase family glycosylhydrolase [uncultured Fibrobacter sp.]|uniref:cellulase family glycosylhydrolase n=1 Tax=uncultured Fibrobacter sp. TaxID=261512 RepID=UPI00262CF8E5|nr:cellulase family glycosylhydrolase [uncultured Fibrobacter sp.]